jgi:hypothetical protein
MNETANINLPNRITDLVNLRATGYSLDINLSFDIIPINFAHKAQEFQAYIFLCRYSGSVEKKAFIFRKCYAKGCPHNLCPHVAQAVMIANRYLKKDYKRLQDAGIVIEEKFFSLEDMIAKYEEVGHEKNENRGGILTIHDYINIAKEGNSVEVEIDLEIIPAVEHFVNEKNKQTYLTADFSIIILGRSYKFQRCLACFQTNNETEEKAIAINTANDRLKLLFYEFDDAKIDYKPIFFN